MKSLKKYSTEQLLHELRGRSSEVQVAAYTFNDFVGACLRYLNDEELAVADVYDSKDTFVGFAREAWELIDVFDEYIWEKVDDGVYYEIQDNLLIP